MSTINLFRYNNYYNKIVKVAPTVEEYGNPVSVTESANFNPNDGISTQHVINTGTSAFSTFPDYCVVTSENGIIESRWFVIDTRRVRAGQYRLSLLRDTIAEYKSQVLASTCFIEKGWVNQGSPLIFNNENMGFNQIKSGEYPLENNLKTPWLVLYLSRYDGEGNYNKFSGSFNEIPLSDRSDYTLNSLEEYKYNYYKDHNYCSWGEETLNQLWLGAYYKNENDSSRVMIRDKEKFIGNSYATFGDNNKNYPKISNISNYNVTEEDFYEIIEEFKKHTIVQGGLEVYTYTENNYDQGIQYVGTVQDYYKLKEENNKIIKIIDSTNPQKYTLYRIDVYSEYGSTATYTYGVYLINPASGLGDKFKKKFFTNNGFTDLSSYTQQYYVRLPYTNLSVKVRYVKQRLIKSK